jgi:membrane protein
VGLDVAGTRERLAATYRTRRDQVQDLVDRIPILGRLVSEFIRIELIDRCMLIAAQGLLALIPMLVVLAAFFPHLTGDAVHSFSSAAGIGGQGDDAIRAQVTPDQVRAQTGWVGVAIVLFSATSFARAVQRMYEKVWERRHVGGVSGTQRCFLWLLGWLLTLQLVGGVRRLLGGVDGLVGGAARLGLSMVLLSLLWWVTSWVLLFGRVAWRQLALGAVLTGSVGVLYNRASGEFMPTYVQSNAHQFGTLGIILAVSTWLIGFAGIMVASALVGRVVSEDPTVRLVFRTAQELLESGWTRLRGARADETGARRSAARPRSR